MTYKYQRENYSGYCKLILIKMKIVFFLMWHYILHTSQPSLDEVTMLWEILWNGATEGLDEISCLTMDLQWPQMSSLLIWVLGFSPAKWKKNAEEISRVMLTQWLF